MAPKYFLLLVVWSCWDVVLAFVPAMPLNTRVARRATASCFAGRAGRAKALRMTANPTSDLPMAPDVRRLESTEPPLPHRTVSSAGYRAADSARTWPDFVYSSAAARREKTVQIRQDIFERSTAEQQEAGLTVLSNDVSLPPTLPVMKIVLIGGPCSGKGTIAPLLSQATSTRVVSVGQLLRSEVRSGTRLGERVQQVMGDGELLQDQLVLDLVRSRITDSFDAQQNGWQLVGFPRTREQARAIAQDHTAAGLKPDCVIVLDRPDELCKEFALGRMTDSATGRHFHPIYAPPPAEVVEANRIVWRSDDTTEIIDKRLRSYHENLQGILDEFAAAGVPVRTVNNARCELETLDEVVAYVDELARAKLLREGGWAAVYRKRYVGNEFEQISQLQELGDVEPLCNLEDLLTTEECLDGWKGGVKIENPYLEAVRRCNTYLSRDFIPVLVGNAQVGWSSKSFVQDLTPHLMQGRAVELVQLSDDSKDKTDTQGKIDIDGHGSALRLAPGQDSLEERTETMSALVRELVEDGVIPLRAVRRELQDVRPISMGFMGGEIGKKNPPMLRLERGAMIHFGVPSFGIHVNGYTVDPTTMRPKAIWIAKRSMSKATYPGMFDQVVAGGQPAGLSFGENCAKECEEEASFPPEVVQGLISTGLISYKYKTRKGLSTKILATFDCPMPQDLTPVCGDGEVEDFRLWTIEEALESIRTQLPLWKPNSALVMVDFAMRHGFISPDDPGYAEICHLLRAGLSIDDLRRRM